MNTQRVSFAFRLASVLFALTLLMGIGGNLVAAQDAPSGPPPSGSPPAGGPGEAGGAGGAAPGQSSTNEFLTADCGQATFDGTTESSDGQAYDSTTTDVSSICAINGANVSLTNPTVTKTGDTSSADNSSFYGVNAAVLAGSGSSVTISGGTVVANGEGANGVFSTGEGTNVTLSDLTIDARGDGAHAVMATLGGTMTLTNVDMNTTDAHAGAVATDRGSGTIDMTGGTVTTSGDGSPGIYSTGAISATNATFTATGSEAAVIEGANSITLTDSVLTSSVDDLRGVMLYQSMSGDAEGTEGAFTMTGGSLAYTGANGPLFFVTNATGQIALSGVELTVTSGILAQAGATDTWGTAGANGGNIVLTADAQTLDGDLVADEISTITLTLANGSTLAGAIDSADTAQSAALTLDASSSWSVTADSHLTTLADDAALDGTTITNITGNGHTVTYDAGNTANAWLNGGTYNLTGGGTLQPA